MKNPLGGPKPLIDIAVLCPLREEFNAVRRCLAKVTSEKRDNLHFDLGTRETSVQTLQIALFETGSGVANLATKTTDIIHTIKPKYIFLIGIAGGVKDVKIGDVVVANKAYGYGGGKDTEDEFLSRPNVILSPLEITEIVRQLARNYESQVPYKIYLAAIASGDKVVSSKNSYTARLIKRLYNDTLALEMEAYGFAMAARDMGIPYANIRGISDLLDSKHKSDYDGSRELAADRAADFWTQILQRLPKIPGPGRGKNQIYYLTKPHRHWYSLRLERRAVLHRYANHLVLTGKKDQEIRNIQHMERVRMPGDFAARWVKILYQDKEGKEQTIFLSNAHIRFPVLANLFGGARKWIKELRKKYLGKERGIAHSSSI